MKIDSCQNKRELRISIKVLNNAVAYCTGKGISKDILENIS